MNYRTKIRKKALDELSEIAQNKDNLLIIHYSCESFYGIEDGRTPRITSIAIRHFSSTQSTSFSIHKTAEKKNIAFDKIEEHYDELEKETLDEYMKFVKNHAHCHWLHWNMRDMNYGFKAIEHRYSVLTGKPVVIEDTKKYDLGKKMKEIFSENYAEHPRLENIVKMNGITSHNFLVGNLEADAFDKKEFVKLHQSTLRKVDAMQELVERILMIKYV